MKKIDQETMNKILKAADKAREKGIDVKLDLRGRDLVGLELMRANLEGANLEGANLKHTSLDDANLKGANLCYAELGGTILKGANLSGASLCFAEFSKTKLNGANLSGADLDFTDFDLSCNSIGIKADSRLINQLAYHLADLIKSSGETVPDAIKERANNSHLIDDHDLPEF